MNNEYELKVDPSKVQWEPDIQKMAVVGLFEIDGQRYRCEIPLVNWLTGNQACEKLEATKRAVPVWDYGMSGGGGGAGTAQYVMSQGNNTTTWFLYTDITNAS